MALLDLSNQRFGRLVVISRASNPGEPVKWLCQCDCGKQKIIRGDSLRNGRTLSCGCLRAELASQRNVKDLVGKTFGKLTVIGRSKNKSNNRNVIWTCKCECGNIVDVIGGSLTSGNTTSCGCKRKETIHEVLGSKLLGQRFGKLIVIKELEPDKNKNIQWLCKCDCGNHHIATSALLLSNKVQSCGCLNSVGELKIIQLLSENNIFYEYQKKFIDCKFPNTLQYAIFDFYVNNEYIIEFDGKQHYGIGNYWGQQDSKEEFEKLMYRDSYKNEWCKNHNIPIIRIPYTHLENLIIDDLKLETSNYIL